MNPVAAGGDGTVSCCWSGVEATLCGLVPKGIVGGPAAVGWRLDAIPALRVFFRTFLIGWSPTGCTAVAEHMIRFVSYLFVHYNFTHALFGGVLLLAMGKMVGERYSPAGRRLAIFLLISGVVGALSYAVILDSPTPLLGQLSLVFMG